MAKQSVRRSFVLRLCRYKKTIYKEDRKINDKITYTQLKDIPKTDSR